MRQKLLFEVVCELTTKQRPCLMAIPHSNIARMMNDALMRSASAFNNTFYVQSLQSLFFCKY